MSQTEVFDPRTQYRAFSDELNRTVRHCRIGKIKLKAGYYKPLSISIAAHVRKEMATLKNTIENSTGKWDILRRHGAR